MKPVFTWLLDQKLHLIYCSIVIICLVIGYNLLNRKPKEIIKTVTITKVVTKEVEKEKLVYTDRITTIKKANGDIVTISDKSHTDMKILAKTSEVDKISKTEVIKFLSKYSIDVLYPINPLQVSLVPNPLDIQVSVGIRVFDLPLFAIIGIDGHFNKVLMGARLEF